MSISFSPAIHTGAAVLGSAIGVAMRLGVRSYSMPFTAIARAAVPGAIGGVLAAVAAEYFMNISMINEKKADLPRVLTAGRALSAALTTFSIVWLVANQSWALSAVISATAAIAGARFNQ